MPHAKNTISMRYLAATLFITCLGAFGQDSAAYRDCNQQAKTQVEMNACASEELKRADAELNQVYTQLLSKASANAEAPTKIKAAKKAWIAYRDAYMDAMYPAADKQFEYGSVYPMEADLVRAKLTRQHVAELKEMLQQYKSRAQ